MCCCVLLSVPTGSSVRASVFFGKAAGGQLHPRRAILQTVCNALLLGQNSTQGKPPFIFSLSWWIVFCNLLARPPPGGCITGIYALSVTSKQVSKGGKTVHSGCGLHVSLFPARHAIDRPPHPWIGGKGHIGRRGRPGVAILPSHFFGPVRISLGDFGCYFPLPLAEHCFDPCSFWD